MATTTKPTYGTNNQTITITLASLANAAQRSCLAVDNTTNLFDNALVSVKIKTGAASTSATGIVVVYVYGTTNGGTTYGGGETGMGTDATVTLTSPPNITPVAVINANANATTYVRSGISIADWFGGVLPDHWGIVVENKTGAALDATAGNLNVNYQGVQLQQV
jgi:hypothetical protein